MGKKWKVVKWSIFVVLIIVLVYFYIQIETDLPYQKATVKPIKVDWRVFEVDYVVDGPIFSLNQSGRAKSISRWIENGTITNKSIVTMLVPPDYNISLISFNVKNPFSRNITGEIKTAPSFGSPFDDFFDVNNVRYVQYNITKINEYKAQNPEDIIVTSTLFVGGNFSTWAMIWDYFSSHDTFNITINSFFQQTSFDSWEAVYLFDNSLRDYTYQNITYEDANLKQLVFSVTIPTDYSVQDPESWDMSTDSEGKTIVTKALQGGETFYLTITKDSNAWIKSIATEIILAIGIFSVLITFLYEKIKKKIEKWL